MAKPNYVYLTGVGKWMHKLFEPDEFRGQRFWAFDLYLDPKALDTFKALKTQKKIKVNDEGMYVTLRRNVAKPWKLRVGESPEFDPPTVTLPDGSKWDSEVQGGLLGNGSKVTAKLEVYPVGDGIGTRLVGVRVDEPVLYLAPLADAGLGKDNPIQNVKIDEDTIPF